MDDSGEEDRGDRPANASCVACRRASDHLPALVCRLVLPVSGRNGTRDVHTYARRAGLTGEQLAGHLGWSQPKISKIETGKTMPTVADVRAYVEVAGASGQEAAELLTRFEELATLVTGWRVLLRSGIAGSQQRVA